MAEVRTFCRVCEPACGLVATVEDGALEKLRPDREHPVTKGFACNKGLAGVEIHRDPGPARAPAAARRGRQLRARRRGTTAIDGDRGEAARDPRPARARRGRRVHREPDRLQHAGRPGGRRVLRAARRAALRSAPGTQDCANKFAGSEAVFGSSTMPPDPGLRAHRVPAGLRREPARLARELHLDRRSDARAQGRAQARREDLLREPARDRVAGATPARRS